MAEAVLNLRSHLVSIDEVVVPRGEITDAVYFVVDGAIAFLASAHASACVEIIQCVRCQAVRNRHRHAIEQASRR